jgi:hypothetical protein
MTVQTARTLSLSLLVTGLGVSGAHAEVPAGWHVAGSAPTEYDFSQTATASSGKYGALIATKSGTASGFGTLMQTIAADQYRGARWRLTGFMKTEQAGRAQMWMRVDGSEGKVLSFDNMDSRVVTGTKDWKRYDIVLDVPSSSINIAFGFFLAQTGKVWGDSFKLEKVDATVPVTSMSPGTPSMPKAPVNPDFER